MATIHQQCIIKLAEERGINLESAKFKYKRMDPVKRSKLQRRVKEDK